MLHAGCLSIDETEGEALLRVLAMLSPHDADELIGAARIGHELLYAVQDEGPVLGCARHLHVFGAPAVPRLGEG